MDINFQRLYICGIDSLNTFAKMENKKLKEALENLLKMAEDKLQYAIDKNKDWDVEHYKKDIEFIKSELSIVNKA